MTTVLIDDVRCFRDGRPCLVARTSAAGLAVLDELRESRIDDLRLDHDLGGEDTIWPVIQLLEDAHLRGRPLDIGTVHVHTARALPAHQMGISLRRAHYTVVRSYSLRMWVW